MELEITIRNLTNGEDFLIVLPCAEEELNKKIGNGSEYVIIDGGIIECSEYTNILELNKFLAECKEYGIGLDTIEILQKVYYWNEVVEMLKNREYVILDTSETDEWAVSGDEALGLFMYEQGYNELPCKVPKELVDYINWEQNWFTLETMGWSKVIYKGTTKVIYKGRP